MSNLNIGDKVTVYEDPVTCQKPEGEAVLRELLFDRGTEQVWRVEFTDAPGEFYDRRVDGETNEVAKYMADGREREEVFGDE